MDVLPSLPPFPVTFEKLSTGVAASGRMGPNEVHLWLCHTAMSYAHMSQHESLLNDEESAHASRIQVPAVRQRFVIARGLLRTLLGIQADCEPRRLTFNFGSHGKPTLGGEHRAASIHFNVSHSGSWVLIGISTGPEIGVDIEVANDQRPWRRIAERMFGPMELMLMNGSDAQALESFYRIWSTREAYLKAIGIGLAGLQREDIVAGAHGMISMENSASRWAAHHLDLPRSGLINTFGAVAVSSAPDQFKAWRV